jgi:glyoxylase-like metal-dependent hydrolase (beta-lactamase superfamily II)/rhodanese-related sulfurtransferase
MSDITSAELKSLLAAGDPVSIVDLRERPEFEAWHIHGSTNLPAYDALRRGSFDALAEGSASLPADRPVVAVCRAGVVSRRAVEWLRAHGFTATSLAGGIRGWGAVWSEAPVSRLDEDGVRLIQVRRNGKGCLSYVLGAKGRAMVVDPSVDASAYVEIAEREGLRIDRVLETHVHADHLSRARELCRIVEARLVMPRNGRVGFAHDALSDGDRIDMGGVVVHAIATPGHTMESMCYRVAGRILLTGDTLFLDSVGRPDLERGDAGAEDGARALYRSLRERLLSQGHGEWIYPAHHGGAIGFDGVPLERSLEEVVQGQPLLAADERRFVATVLRALPAKPPNHASVIAVNEGRMDWTTIDPLDLEAGPNRCACA